MIQVIKNIFGDISLLYKSFFHWNISKILIVIFAFFLWILVSLPFFAILWIVVYFDPIDWKDIAYNYYTTESFGLSLMTALSSYLWYIILEWILFILAVWFFMFGYSYKTISLTNLNLSYLNQEKIWFFKNVYFNFSTIWKYLWVISWISLILLVPFLLFLVIFVVTLFSLWGLDVVSNMVRENYTNPFTIIVWVSFFTLLLVFLYLAYRMSFSYVIMLDDKNYVSDKNNKIINIIFYSWILLNLFAIVFLAFFLYLSFSMKLQEFLYIILMLLFLKILIIYLLYKMKKYLFYIIESFKISSWVKIFKFLLMVIIYTIILLPFDYIWGKVEEMELVSLLYWILIFFVFGWVFEMLVVSIYKNIMLWENNLEILNTEEKEEIV